jgi:hypothetical protein
VHCAAHCATTRGAVLQQAAGTQVDGVCRLLVNLQAALSGAARPQHPRRKGIAGMPRRHSESRSTAPARMARAQRKQWAPTVRGPNVAVSMVVSNRKGFKRGRLHGGLQHKQWAAPLGAYACLASTPVWQAHTGKATVRLGGYAQAPTREPRAGRQIMTTMGRLGC